MPVSVALFKTTEISIKPSPEARSFANMCIIAMWRRGFALKQLRKCKIAAPKVSQHRKPLVQGFGVWGSSFLQ